MSGNVLESLREFIADCTDNPQLQLTPEMQLTEIPGFTSLLFVSVMTMLQEKYQLKFDIRSIQNLRTVGQLLELAEKHS